MERAEPKASSAKSNKYAYGSFIFAISAWIILVLLLQEYVAFAATVLAIVFSIAALYKKQDKILAITGGVIALMLFVGLMIPSIIK